MPRGSIIKWFFLIWLCLEIAGFVWVADLIGTGWMLVWLIASMVFGISLLRREGLNAANIMMQKARSGQKPNAADLADSPRVMFAAILFIIPGFFTDILGVLCFLPAVRHMVLRLLGKTKSSAKPKKPSNESIHKGRTFEGDFKEHD
jgi:UPF0716 protein FxsA